MCVIAVYEKTRPDLDEVKKIMKANPDGAGLGWVVGGEVCWKKGFNNPEQVYKYIKKLKHASTVVLHARIATSGGVSGGKCHPYPIDKNPVKMERLFGCGDMPILFHNGVLHIEPENGLNDTQTFIKNALCPILEDKRTRTELCSPLFNMAIHGSKIAILTKKGCNLLGEGWTTKNGATYSNLIWEYYEYNGGYYGGRYGASAWLWDKQRKEFYRLLPNGQREYEFEEVD